MHLALSWRSYTRFINHFLFGVTWRARFAWGLPTLRKGDVLGLVIMPAMLCVGSVVAQPFAANSPTAPSVDNAGYSIVESGPHHSIWQNIVAQTNIEGSVSYHTNVFTQLATGLNHLVAGQWVESSEDIQLTASGGAATNAQHQVYFTANINTPGSIELITPHGRHLAGTVLGMSLYDSQSGQNAIIAQLQTSIGQILPSANQVLYTNALVDSQTDFQADILYTHKKTGFEQDVILHEQPPSPSSFGLNPDTTMLQVWTEFYNTADPDVSTNTIAVSIPTIGQSSRRTLENETLKFGSMQMDQGTAFISDGSTNSTSASSILLVPVAKHWVRQNDRRFLVEEVPFNSIAQQLITLPQASPTGNGPSGGASSPQSFFRSPAKADPAQAKAQSLMFASSTQPARLGFVMDYNMINNNFTNFTFQSDTTYFLSGTVNLYGTTVLEGGAVLKCDTGGEAAIVMNGNIVCHTAAYRPAIFTCTNDNSVGVPLSSSNNPTLSISSFLYCPNGGSITNVRFSYAWNGVSGLAGDMEVTDCQFVNCSHPITVNSTTTNLGLHNVLITMNDSINNSVNFCSCAPGALTIYSAAIKISAEHLTADLGSQYFIEYYTTPNLSLTSIALTNSIILAPHLNPYYSYGTSIALSPTTNATYYATTKPTNLFQTVGSASHYLSSNSPCLGMGTTNINSTVLADISQKTTQPPTVFAYTYLTNSMTLGQQTWRDVSSTPDLGYHYDPIDFAFGASFLTNAALTVTPGTVLAGFDTNASGYSLTIGPGGTFNCQGAPTNLSRIVNYNTVQEQANTNWYTPSHGLILPNWSTNTPTSMINLRFTDMSILAADTAHVYAVSGKTAPINFQDCQLHGGSLTSTNPTINLTNCLLERVNTKIWSLDTNIFHVQNNLFWNGTNDIQFAAKTNTVIQNNLFDKTSINDHGSTGYVGGYNGYVTNFNRLTLNNLTDKILTNSPAYQTSYLGTYYLPTNCPLTNAGSTTADLVGLFHYTTQTNQIKETNSIVDISYHYVAVDSFGVPDDLDGDGIPDYLEDANGNGLIDVGESSWLLNAFNGLSSSNTLQVYTPLK